MNLHPLTLVALSAAAPATAGLAITEEHSATVVLLVATTVTIAGIITWIDRRIAKQIETHSEQDKLRHEAVLKEIAHVKEMLTFADSEATKRDDLMRGRFQGGEG